MILLDLKMPDMNGPAFLREFQKEQRTIPVIIVTGHPDDSLMAEALQYGPFTMLAKPIVREQLLQAIGTLLNGVRKAWLQNSPKLRKGGTDESKAP